MTTFETIREFVVPSNICDGTDRQLQDAGREGFERFVLWSGVTHENRFLVRTMHVPKQTARRTSQGLSVHVGGDELHELNMWLYSHKELLAVQVHAHPDEAYHSQTDDTYPIVTTLGGLSLVVPDFAELGVRGEETALYRLTRTGWTELSCTEARVILQMEH